MTGRVSPLALSLLAVAGWMVSLGVVSGRPELIVAGLPVLLLLATLARPAARPDYVIEQEIGTDRVFEGDEVTVTMTVTARSPIGLIELLGPRPAGSVVRSGRHRAVMTLGAGASGRASYTLAFPGRGAHDLGAIAIRVPDVEAARAELESKGVLFDGDTIVTSVCTQAWFKDPDGNALMLHRRFDA